MKENINISYRNRKIIIILLLILLVILGYKRVVKSAYGQLLLYVNSIPANTSSISDSLAVSLAKVKQLDGVLGQNSMENVQLQQKLLEFLSKKNVESQEVLVTSIKPLHVYSEKGYEITSFFCTISGSYNNILEVVYLIEKEFTYSKLGSLKLYSKYDYKTKRKVLYAELVFQNIKLR